MNQHLSPQSVRPASPRPLRGLDGRTGGNGQVRPEDDCPHLELWTVTETGDLWLAWCAHCPAQFQSDDHGDTFWIVQQPAFTGPHSPQTRAKISDAVRKSRALKSPES